jgi:hypothetical protein
MLTAHFLIGLLILIMGAGFHWLGQLASLLNRELAIRLGLVEKDLPAGYRAYEDALAVADAALGWVYGLAGVGLMLDARWGYAMAWAPGFMFVYHGISAWMWEGHRRRQGHRLWSDGLRIGWCGANLIIGLLALGLAFAAL